MLCICIIYTFWIIDSCVVPFLVINSQSFLHFTHKGQDNSFPMTLDWPGSLPVVPYQCKSVHWTSTNELDDLDILRKLMFYCYIWSMHYYWQILLMISKIKLFIQKIRNCISPWCKIKITIEFIMKNST